MRNRKLADGCYYHIFNKSIDGFEIFRYSINAVRFIQLMNYYNNQNKKISFAHYIRNQANYKFDNWYEPNDNTVAKIIAFCVMPTHYHLMIQAANAEMVSKYISDLENSYSRFLNIKMNRKGPLWQSRFKAVRIKNDTQLLHTTRYVNINPVVAGLVEKAEDWQFSSYIDYITKPKILTEYLTELTISSCSSYRQFCEDKTDYQKKLKLIKKCIFE
jgi:putative transposase